MARVLLVDDEPSIRTTLRVFLEREHHTVATASDVDEATRLLNAHAFDIVVTDIIMPGHSGVELLASIRERSPEVEVILITGDPNLVTAIKAVREGAFDYISKPVSGIALTKVVAAAANAKAIRDENNRAYDRAREYTETLEGMVLSRTEELAESERRYARLVHDAPDGIVSANLDGYIETFNPAAERIAGQHADEVLARHFGHIGALNAKQRQLAREGFAALCQSDAPQSFAVALPRRNGSHVHIEIVARRVPGPNGNDRVQATVRDVTERVRADAKQRELEEQLRHALRLESVGRLAGGIAHDFNNLLTVISCVCSLLDEDVDDPTAVREGVANISEAARRAESLVRHLLAFSRRQILRPEVVDLNAIVEGTLNMLRRLLGEDTQIRLELDSSIGRVYVDPGQIEQALVNLTVNARDSMPRGGELFIRTSATISPHVARQSSSKPSTEPWCRIEVRDRGCGMDEATRARIFEPFFTTKSPSRGTGLGLSMVHGIVTQSGGEISVHSEVGRGTTFFIDLPTTNVRATPRPLEPPRTMTTNGGSERILVVEDNDAVRRLATEILTTRGYTVTSARDGTEALALLRAGTSVDLLVTDLVMPGKSGREVAEAFTQAWPKMRVLYMSGYSDEAIERRGLLGKDMVLLSKPFTAQGIANKVRQVLDAADQPLEATHASAVSL